MPVMSRHAYSVLRQLIPNLPENVVSVTVRFHMDDVVRVDVEYMPEHVNHATRQYLLMPLDDEG